MFSATIGLQGALTLSGGGDDDFTMTPGGGVLTLASTGAWDSVIADDASIALSNAQTTVSGGGNSISLGGADDAVGLYATDDVWDGVSARAGRSI